MLFLSVKSINNRMLTHNELKRGVQVIVDGEPYEVLEASPLKMAMRRPVIQSKIKSLISGKTIERNFQQGDTFQEADIEKFKAKFVYGHRGKYVFCEVDDPSKRFELTVDQVGEGMRFLKSNEVIDGLKFEGNIINISLPVKVQLRVTDAPPGLKGDSAKGGTKLVTLETGAQIQAPLFIETGDVLEINTDTGEYSKRVQ